MRTIYEQYIDNISRNEKFNKEVYRSIYKLNWDVLGHYFRGVQWMINFINSLHTNKYDSYFFKKKYFEIFKSQLSEYETTMIFYHFLFIEDKKYKELAEKFGLFEFINIELVTDDTEYYDENAFL